MSSSEERLKILELAVLASKGSGVVKTTEQIVDTAEKFEQYVSDNTPPTVVSEPAAEDKPSVVDLDKPTPKKRKRNR